MEKVEEGTAPEATLNNKHEQTSSVTEPRTAGARTLAAEDGEQGNKALWEQLRNKDAQITILHQKLAHFRSWVATVHTRVQAMNPHAIKNAKRLYVGNLPNMTEEELKHFMNGLMARAGGVTGPGMAVTGCKIIQDKGYGFVEFRSVEEASNAMALDGVACKDSYIKLRRPSNYDIATSHMLGPVTPDPTMDTTTLDICRTMVEDSPNKLFIGGLPSEWTEDQVKELLLPYGPLRSFNLVMDKATGKSKGYAFCEFSDEAMTDFVIGALSGKKAGGKTMTVKRALEGGKHGVGGGPMHPMLPTVAGLPGAANGVGSANQSGLLQLAHSTSSTSSHNVKGQGAGYGAGPQGQPVSSSSSSDHSLSGHPPGAAVVPASAGPNTGPPYPAPGTSPGSMSMYMPQGVPRNQRGMQQVGSPPHMAHGPRMMGPSMPPMGPMPIPPMPMNMGMNMGGPGPHGMPVPGYGYYPPGQPYPHMPMPGPGMPPPPHHYQQQQPRQGPPKPPRSSNTSGGPQPAPPPPPPSQPATVAAAAAAAASKSAGEGSAPSSASSVDKSASVVASGGPAQAQAAGGAGAPAHMATGGSPSTSAQQPPAAAPNYAVAGAGNKW